MRQRSMIVGLDIGTVRIKGALGEYEGNGGPPNIVMVASSDDNNQNLSMAVIEVIERLRRHLPYSAKQCIAGYSAPSLNPAAQEILDLIESMGLKVNAAIPSVIAAARSLLSEEERGGSLFLDIGGQASALLVYEERKRVFFDIMPIGGEAMVEGLSKEFSVEAGLARRLLTKYGCADAGLIDEDETVTLFDKNKKSIAFNRRRACGIIEERLGEIFAKAKERLAQFNAAYSPKTIVMTGGVSLMDEALEKAQKAFGAPTKLGLIRNIKTRNPSFKNSLYSAAIGLLMPALEDEADLAYSNRKVNRVRRFFSDTKTIYKEYF